MEKVEVLKNPVKCNYCPKEFKSNKYCKRHMKNVHKRNENGELIKDIEKISFPCVLCNKKYSRNFNLQRHLNSAHLETTKPHKCANCDYSTYEKSSLKRHTLKVHCSRHIFELQCTECQAKFKRKTDLTYHERKVHKIGKPKFQIRRKCPLCKYTAVGYKKDEIYKHFEAVHGVKIKTTNLKFNNMKEFIEWKSKIEKKTTTSFVKTNASPSVTYFQCHRCGTYKSKGKNLRHLKISGSCKIGGFCPAAVTLKSTGDSFDVVYTSTHVGHRKELKHMRLTKEERKKLALQLATKIPHEEIPKCIRSSVTNSDLSRMHLTNDGLTIDLPAPSVSITDQVYLTLSLEDEEHLSLLEQEKEVLRQELNDILSEVDIMEQIMYLKQEMKKIKPTVQAIKASEGMVFQQMSTNNLPGNEQNSATKVVCIWQEEGEEATNTEQTPTDEQRLGIGMDFIITANHGPT